MSAQPPTHTGRFDCRCDPCSSRRAHYYEQMRPGARRRGLLHGFVCGALGGVVIGLVVWLAFPWIGAS